MSDLRSRELSYPSYRVRRPNLLGGALCLDFINTVEWRGPPVHGERLVSYDELLVWAESAGAIGRKAAVRLGARARARPDRAAAALAAGHPLTAGGIEMRLVKPAWAQFAWPGEAKAAQ